MTRFELDQLRKVAELLDEGRPELCPHAVLALDRLIEDAEHEHDSEDRYNDWAELDHAASNREAA
jgi:hypothetical protein